VKDDPDHVDELIRTLEVLAMIRAIRDITTLIALEAILLVWGLVVVPVLQVLALPVRLARR
jgi:hypothetical protein